MIPPYRLCQSCHAKGKETRIGTRGAPLIQVAVGLLEDGLNFDARLPRWAWQLWTRFLPEAIAKDDEMPGQLEPVPVKHELCVGCAAALLDGSEKHQVLTQREYREEHRDRFRKLRAAVAAELSDDSRL